MASALETSREISGPNFCQAAPFIDFFHGVIEIDRRVDEKIIGDADLSLVGVDHA